MKKILLFVFLFFYQYAWVNSQEIKSYYFPYQNFIHEKHVYKYINTMDTSIYSFWEMETFVKGKDTAFVSSVYDRNGTLIEIMQESIKPKGVLLENMTIFFNTSAIKTKVNSNQNTVFKWQQKKKEKIEWEIEAVSGDSYDGFSNSKTRELISENVTKVFQSKSYLTIQFSDQFSVTQYGFDTVSFKSTRNSYYAKDLGLIEFEDFDNNVVSSRFVLAEILDLKEWTNYRELNFKK